MILTRATSTSSLITHHLYHSTELEKKSVNNPRIRSRTAINLMSSSNEKRTEPQVVAYRTIEVCWWVTTGFGNSFPRGKADRAWSWAIMTSNTRIKNQWKCTAASAQVVMPWCLIRHRHCLIFVRASAHYSDTSRKERSGKTTRVFWASERNGTRSQTVLQLNMQGEEVQRILQNALRRFISVADIHIQRLPKICIHILGKEKTVLKL
jgi:hypothetical protein